MFTFTKIEKLCGKIAIDELFSKGKSKTQYPFKLIYKSAVFDSEFPVRAMFVVPKKKHKRANKRNTIKRRMREVYRLHKHDLYQALTDKKLDVMFICLTSDELTYQQIEKPLTDLMNFLKTQPQAINRI